MRIVSTLLGSKPGATARSARVVRMSSAEPTSRMSASAISATTSTERALFCVNSVNETEENAGANRDGKRVEQDAPVDSYRGSVDADKRQAGRIDREQSA